MDTMQFVDFIVYGNIRWNIRRDDPKTISLKSLPGWSFINPLAMLSSQEKSKLNPMLTSNEECHLLSNTFSFRVPEGEQNPAQHTDSIGMFLRNLRFVTKQSALTSDIAGIRIHEKQRMPRKIFPERAKGYLMLIGSYRLKTAITFPSIIEADELGLALDVPLYATMMLDALHAFESRDYRKAILYSAISMESLGRTMAFSDYKRLIESDADPQYLRVCEFTQAGDTTSKKDPVFDFLMKGENFPKLLHEVPLYISKRSLLMDNQALYRNAVNLYRTRNRLGHGQDVTDNADDLFPPNENGTRSALDCACKVFEWFGETEYYVPIYDKVPIGS